MALRPAIMISVLAGCIAAPPHLPAQFGGNPSNNAAAAAATHAAQVKAQQAKDQALQQSDEHAELIAQQEGKAPADPQATLAVHDGDPIEVKLTSALSTKTAKRGDPVFFVLTGDLKVNGVLVAPSGTRVVGEVAWCEKMVGTAQVPADLVVRLEYLNAGTKKVHLRGTAEKKVGGLFPFGAAELPAGLVVKGYIGEDILLAPAKPAAQ